MLFCCLCLRLVSQSRRQRTENRMWNCFWQKWIKIKTQTTLPFSRRQDTWTRFCVPVTLTFIKWPFFVRDLDILKMYLRSDNKLVVRITSILCIRPNCMELPQIWPAFLLTLLVHLNHGLRARCSLHLTAARNSTVQSHPALLIRSLIRPWRSVNFTVSVLYCDAVALLAVHLTCDLQIAGSSPGWAPLRSGLGQSYILTPVCLCHQAILSLIWYWPRVISLTGKVTAALVESNGSLPPGLWLMSPVGWLPKTGISSVPNARNWVWDYFTFLLRPGKGAEYCDQPVCPSVCLRVCVSVCPRAYLCNRWTYLHAILRADPLWPWFGPPVVALR